MTVQHSELQRVTDGVQPFGALSLVDNNEVVFATWFVGAWLRFSGANGPMRTAHQQGLGRVLVHGQQVLLVPIHACMMKK